MHIPLPSLFSPNKHLRWVQPSENLRMNTGGFWACWCSQLLPSTPQARFFMLPIKGEVLSPDFPQCTKGSSHYPLPASLFASFPSLLSSHRNIKCLSSVSLFIQTSQHLRQKGQQDEATLRKNIKIKTTKGPCFWKRNSWQEKKKMPFWQEKSVRATSRDQFFVISAVGLDLHCQILLAFPDTPARRQNITQVFSRADGVFRSAPGVSGRIFQLFLICDVCLPVSTPGHILKTKNIS